MNQPIKISRVVTTVELFNVEQLPAVISLMLDGATAIDSDGRPAPAPMPEPAAAETAPTPDAATGADDSPATLPLDIPPAAPAPRRRRPSSVFVTGEEAQAIRLLRQHPNGLTSAEIAPIIGKDADNAGAMMSKLRAVRPNPAIGASLLVTRVGRRYFVTTLGRNLTLKIAARPNYPNRKLGWFEES